MGSSAKPLPTWDEAFPGYFEKWKGAATFSGIPYPFKKWWLPILYGIGGFIMMAVLLLLTTGKFGGFNVIACFVPPYAATMVILNVLSDLPVAQPRNVIGGYFLAGVIGMIVWTLTGPTQWWWAMAISVGLAIIVQMMTKTMHPPSMVSAILPMLFKVTDWMWILVPNTLGAIILVIIALIYVNLIRGRRYPAFWW